MRRAQWRYYRHTLVARTTPQQLLQLLQHTSTWHTPTRYSSCTTLSASMERNIAIPAREPRLGGTQRSIRHELHTQYNQSVQPPTTHYYLLLYTTRCTQAIQLREQHFGCSLQHIRHTLPQPPPRWQRCRDVRTAILTPTQRCRLVHAT